LIKLGRFISVSQFTCTHNLAVNLIVNKRFIVCNCNLRAKVYPRLIRHGIELAIDLRILCLASNRITDVKIIGPFFNNNLL